MLLWISAAGLAGAGWFGWLVYRDYDWSSVRSPANSRSMPYTKAYNAEYQKDIQEVDTNENDLLGRTNTRWDGAHDLSRLYEKTEEEFINADSQQTDSAIGESDTVQTGHNVPQSTVTEPDAARRSATHEDFVVIEPSLSVPATTDKLDFEVRPSIHEDFVVVQAEQPEIGVSPFLATTNEDFVVVGDPGDEGSEELPEVDLTDYVNSWTPIVPKIAALISHELWPQLRSFLESLPQFGDTNLERVVNAVAEDVGINAATADGVGEGHAGCRQAEGFAFYASLFDEMAQEPELADADPITA